MNQLLFFFQVVILTAKKITLYDPEGKRKDLAMDFFANIR